MPTVDFTLEDIGKQTEQIVEKTVEKTVERTVERIVDARIEQALVKERVHTRAMMEEVTNTAFASFWDDNLAPVLEEIHTELKTHRRLLDQHSMDIMELRARTA